MDGDLAPLQEIVQDFGELYSSYYDSEYFSGLDYGYAARLDGATPLVEYDELALYFVHSAGQGTVFFTNPLLPNVFSINGFSLEQTGEVQTYSINTTSSANQIIRNAFAAYISKINDPIYVMYTSGSTGVPKGVAVLHRGVIDYTQWVVKTFGFDENTVMGNQVAL